MEANLEARVNELVQARLDATVQRKMETHFKAREFKIVMSYLGTYAGGFVSCLLAQPLI
jgi:hypothetical protein